MEYIKTLALCYCGSEYLELAWSVDILAWGNVIAHISIVHNILLGKNFCSFMFLIPFVLYTEMIPHVMMTNFMINFIGNMMNRKWLPAWRASRHSTQLNPVPRHSGSFPPWSWPSRSLEGRL